MAWNRKHTSGDDDYMSNDLLAQIPDRRPGLLSRDAARLQQSERRHKKLNEKNKQPSFRKIEEDKRHEALNKSAMTADNKGFAIMQKMGFKTGMSIGKSGDGRKEPVGLQLKAGRSGLGHDTEVTRKRNIVTAAQFSRKQKRQKMEQRLQKDFRTRLVQQTGDRQNEIDLYKSQQVCEQLDAQHGLKEPPEIFFWPPAMVKKLEKQDEDDLDGVPLNDDGYDYELKDDDNDDDEDEDDEAGEEEDEDEISAKDKLEILTLYLRNHYKYCVWCGTKYEDREDMNKNCPGSTSADHEDM